MCVVVVVTTSLFILSQTDADKDIKKISKVAGSELLLQGGGTGTNGIGAAGGSGSINRARRSSLDDLRVGFATLNECQSVSLTAARRVPFQSDSTSH